MRKRAALLLALYGAATLAAEDPAVASARYHALLDYSTASLVIETPELAIEASVPGSAQFETAMAGATAASYCADVLPLLSTGPFALLAVPCLGLLGATVEESKDVTVPRPAGAALASGLAALPIDELLRREGARYLEAMGVPPAEGGDCPPGNPRALRLAIAPDTLKIRSERIAGAHLHTVALQFAVRRELPCGSTDDAYRFLLAIGIETEESMPSDAEILDLQRRLADGVTAAIHGVIDESLLVWHPQWLPRKSAPGSFTTLALAPLSPPVRHGLAASIRRPSGVNGLGIADAGNGFRVFRWQPLSELIARDGAEAAQPESVRYQFRLYAAEPGVLESVRPGRQLLAQDGLASESLELPGPLEPCRIYFWTVRAHFLYAGRPRVTEWTALHNAIGNFGGISEPWRFRRGDESWTKGWPVDWTYPAFRTPAPEGMKKCMH